LYQIQIINQDYSITPPQMAGIAGKALVFLYSPALARP
jgi:hypothetical protein